MINSRTIKYITHDGKLIGSQAIDPHIKLTESITLAVPTNWRLKDQTIDSNNFKLDTFKNDKSISLTILPIIETKNETRIITREIIIHEPNMVKKVVKKQTTKFTRTISFNKATDKETTGDWVGSGLFQAIKLPEFKDYAPDSTVSDKIVNANDQNIIEHIFYHSIYNSIAINYEDSDHHLITTQLIKGKINSNVDIKSNLDIPDNWELNDNTSVPISATIMPQNNLPITIGIKHKSEEVTDKNLITKKIKRTILLRGDTRFIPSSQSTEITQVATLRRKGIKDLVTGKYSFDQWSNGELYEYSVPQFEGITPDISTIGELSVNDKSIDTRVTVHYTANKYDVNIIYLDDQTPIYHQIISGRYQETVPVQNQVPKNWRLVEPKNFPDKIVFNGQQQDYSIPIEHQVIDITNRYDQEDATLIKKVRPISYIDPRTYELVHMDQVAFIKRKAYLDLVTSQITYSDYEPAFFKMVRVPEFKGFVTDQAVIPERRSTIDEKVPEIKFGYRPAQRQKDILFIDDETDQQISKQVVTSITNKYQALQLQLPHGWVVSANENVPLGFDFKPNDSDEPLRIRLTHMHKPVFSDDARYRSQLEKTIIRTILIHNVDGTTKTHHQKVTLHREAIQDLVTGELQYQSWNTGEFPEYQAPILPGYTANVKLIHKQPVTSETDSETVEINYTADYHEQVINFRDENGNTIASQTISGQTSDVKAVNLKTPENWHLLGNQAVPEVITFGIEKLAPIYLAVAHDIKDVTNNGNQYDKTHHQVTRTIVLDRPKNHPFKQIDPTTGQEESRNQLIQQEILTRTAHQDMVTNEIKYGEWSHKHFDAIIIPQITGYHTDHNVISAIRVTENTADSIITIKYLPDEQQQDFIFLDENGKMVDTQTLIGHVEQPLDIQLTPPHNWTLVANQGLPSRITLSSTKLSPMQVMIKHQVKDVTDTNEAESEKTIKRIINITNPLTGKINTQTQKVTLYRQIEQDLVTKETFPSAWSTNYFEHVDVPAIAGYTPNMSSIGRLQVNGEMQDLIVDIRYQPLDQHITINYYDDHHQQVDSETIYGKTDYVTPIKLTKVPDFWNIINQDSIPTSHKFTADDNTIITVQMAHELEPIVQNDRNNIKVITRNIIMHRFDESHMPMSKKITQKVKLQRSAKLDLVTQLPVYGPWSRGKFEEYPIPQINGFVPEINAVPEKDVTIDSDDETIDVNYQASEVKIHALMLDSENYNKVLVNQILTAKTFDHKTVNFVYKPHENTDTDFYVTVPKGYELIDLNANKQIVFSPDSEDIVMNLKHQHETVTDPKLIQKEVTRLIRVHNPLTGEVDEHKQTSAVTRTGDKDVATGKIKYSDWQGSTLKEYSVPEFSGYQPNHETLPEIAIDTSTDPKLIVDVTYQAKTQHRSVNYVDEMGNVIASQPVKGKTDQLVPIKLAIPDNWELVDPSLAPKSMQLNADNNRPVNIIIKHQTKDATNDDETQTDKVVTRIINFISPNGETKTKKQEALLHRKAQLDMVTGKIQYGPFSTDVWEAITVPYIAGYVADQTAINDQKVTGDTTSATIDIHYRALDQRNIISFVDVKMGNNPVATQVVTGKTNQHLKVDLDLPQGYKLVDSSNPLDLTLTTHNKPIELKVDHIIQDVANSDPNASETVTRKIIVHSPDGDVSTEIQQCNFKRSAKKDLVTGRVRYGVWQSDNDILPAFNVPTLSGYTPSRSVIPELKIDPDTMDSMTTKIQYYEL